MFLCWNPGSGPQAENLCKAVSSTANSSAGLVPPEVDCFYCNYFEPWNGPAENSKDRVDCMVIMGDPGMI